ncbi:hypothetical protein CARUB_v10009550mg [Capsella rubella]|uniref:Uncharacterized protein n=1 Tax=Capsella rubella TaxID=81985 RepID=R0GQ87_9BRAS|nr:uncharacterized protein LOC17896986 [Capsella rubella]EOA38082.1 hypothetical protein CARUB_v10009550mg [Capsella rubella]
MDRVSSSSDLLIDDLLEEYWFFENLFTRRSGGLRYCHSDPYPSSSTTTSTSAGEMGDSDSCKALEASLIRAPSVDSRDSGSDQMKLRRQSSENIRVQEPRQLGSSLQNKEHMVLPKSGSRSAPGKIQEASTKRGLIRAPSLPPQIDKREVDHEAKKMINKLTRQFSEKIRVLEPNKSGELFLQKKETMVRDKWISERNKTRSSSSSSSKSSAKICLQRTQTLPNSMKIEEDNEEDEFEDQESDSRMGFLIREALASSHNVSKASSNQRQRPPRSLRSEDTVMVKQGSSSPKTLRKTLSSIETTKEIQRLKDYDGQLAEPRVTNGQATPPKVPKDSRKEMKDQIKFWARAVATNVRQEC